MEAQEGGEGQATVRGGGQAGPGAPRSLALSFSSGAAGAGERAGPKGGGSAVLGGLAAAAAAAAARGEGRQRRRRRRERAPRAAGATERRRTREGEKEEGRAPGWGEALGGWRPDALARAPPSPALLALLLLLLPLPRLLSVAQRGGGAL